MLTFWAFVFESPRGGLIKYRPNIPIGCDINHLNFSGQNGRVGFEARLPPGYKAKFGIDVMFLPLHPKPGEQRRSIDATVMLLEEWLRETMRLGNGPTRSQDTIDIDD